VEQDPPSWPFWVSAGGQARGSESPCGEPVRNWPRHALPHGARVREMPSIAGPGDVADPAPDAVPDRDRHQARPSPRVVSDGRMGGLGCPGGSRRGQLQRVRSEADVRSPTVAWDRLTRLGRGPPGRPRRASAPAPRASPQGHSPSRAQTGGWRLLVAPRPLSRDHTVRISRLLGDGGALSSPSSPLASSALTSADSSRPPGSQTRARVPLACPYAGSPSQPSGGAGQCLAGGFAAPHHRLPTQRRMRHPSGSRSRVDSQSGHGQPFPDRRGSGVQASSRRLHEQSRVGSPPERPAPTALPQPLVQLGCARLGSDGWVPPSPARDRAGGAGPHGMSASVVQPAQGMPSTSWLRFPVRDPGDPGSWAAGRCVDQHRVPSPGGYPRPIRRDVPSGNGRLARANSRPVRTGDTRPGSREDVGFRRCLWRAPPRWRQPPRPRLGSHGGALLCAIVSPRARPTPASQALPRRGGLTGAK